MQSQLVELKEKPTENNHLPLDCSWLTNDDRFDNFEHQAAHISELRTEARIMTGVLMHIMGIVEAHGIPKDQFRAWVKGDWEP